jgi:hypothetical protein
LAASRFFTPETLVLFLMVPAGALFLFTVLNDLLPLDGCRRTWEQVYTPTLGTRHGGRRGKGGV